MADRVVGRDPGEHGCLGLGAVLEAERVPVLVAGNALDVHRVITVQEEAGAVVPGPRGVVEADPPAVGGGDLREGEDGGGDLDHGDDVPVRSSCDGGPSAVEGVEVGLTGAQAGLGGVRLAGTVGAGAPLGDALPDGELGSDRAGEVRVRGQVVVGLGIGEVGQDPVVALAQVQHVPRQVVGVTTLGEREPEGPRDQARGEGRSVQACGDQGVRAR